MNGLKKTKIISLLLRKKNKPYFYAAWDAYLNYVHPYDNVFKSIAKQYLKAVKQLEKKPSKDNHLENREKNLVNHIIQFYWRGLIELHDKNEILKQFFDNASDYLKQHVWFYVGRSFSEAENKIPNTIVERTKKLWIYRKSYYLNKGFQKVEILELEYFGWLFISGKFEKEWAINELVEALKICYSIDPANETIKLLSEYSKKYTKQSMECLDIIIRNQVNDWELFGVEDNIHIILSNSLISNDSKTKRKAESLINWFGLMKNYSYKNLLESKDEHKNN